MESSENVPSPTHPPVVINAADDDEDDDGEKNRVYKSDVFLLFQCMSPRVVMCSKYPMMFCLHFPMTFFPALHVCCLCCWDFVWSCWFFFFFCPFIDHHGSLCNLHPPNLPYVNTVCFWGTGPSILGGDAWCVCVAHTVGGNCAVIYSIPPPEALSLSGVHCPCTPPSCSSEVATVGLCEAEYPWRV